MILQFISKINWMPSCNNQHGSLFWSLDLSDIINLKIYIYTDFGHFGNEQCNVMTGNMVQDFGQPIDSASSVLRLNEKC